MRDVKGRFTKGYNGKIKKGKMLLCRECNASVYVPAYRSSTFRYCSRKCSGKNANAGRVYQSLSQKTKNKISKTLMGKMAGDKHYNWQGGVQKHGDGYLQVYKPDHPSSDSRGRILQHRYLMELHIGRTLKMDEHVHHINGDKIDNRIENLQIVSNSQHLKEHWQNAEENNFKNAIRTQFKKGQIPWNKK